MMATYFPYIMIEPSVINDVEILRERERDRESETCASRYGAKSFPRR